MRPQSPLHAPLHLCLSTYVCLPVVLFGRYDGPRLPRRLHTRGRYVLQVPGTSTVIDGDGENSPFEHSRSTAIFANHSSRPNAHLETWPVLRPGMYEVRQHVMLVASERIEAGQELRIDYEDGGDTNYWNGEEPPETCWRRSRVHPPPPGPDEPVYNRLQELQAAAAIRDDAPPCAFPSSQAEPIAWTGATGGDARLRALLSLLSVGGRDANPIPWSLVSTHVPGRSGRECKDRWTELQSVELADCG